jgi:hypothetical protein
MSETASAAFGIGDHVVLELDTPEGERTICGYLMGGNDEEFYLKVTHKSIKLQLFVGDESKAKIRAGLEARSTPSLMREAWRYSSFKDAVLASRLDLLYELQKVREAELLEDADQGVKLRELDAPVMTMVTRDYIRTMESTSDKAFGAEVASFGETAAAGFEEMLKELDETKEENDGTEETKHIEP